MANDPLFDLSGKVAVITGGSGILCSAMAREFAGRGVRVALLGRTFARLEARWSNPPPGLLPAWHSWRIC